MKSGRIVLQVNTRIGWRKPIPSTDAYLLEEQSCQISKFDQELITFTYRYSSCCCCCCCCYCFMLGRPSVFKKHN